MSTAATTPKADGVGAGSAASSCAKRKLPPLVSNPEKRHRGKKGKKGKNRKNSKKSNEDRSKDRFAAAVSLLSTGAYVHVAYKADGGPPRFKWVRFVVTAVDPARPSATCVCCDTDYPGDGTIVVLDDQTRWCAVRGACAGAVRGAGAGAVRGACAGAVLVTKGSAAKGSAAKSSTAKSSTAKGSAAKGFNRCTLFATNGCYPIFFDVATAVNEAAQGGVTAGCCPGSRRVPGGEPHQHARMVGLVLTRAAGALAAQHGEDEEEEEEEWNIFTAAVRAAIKVAIKDGFDRCAVGLKAACTSYAAAACSARAK